MKEGAVRQIVLANWGRRFLAWTVDYVLIVLMLAYFQLESIEDKYTPPILLPKAPGTDLSIWSPLSILIFFLYFTFSEWYFGRSIGQLLLNIQLVDISGEAASLRAAAIQSIGKSTPLFLFFDCLFGVIYRPSKAYRQRIFNRISNTVVTFIGTSDRVIREGKYAKEP